MYGDYLSHYGVMGMHWGRHKRVESDSVQRARKKVNDSKEEYTRSKRVFNQRTSYGLRTNKELMKRVQNSQLDVKYAKQDFGNSKILDKLNSKPKSEHQLKLENKYKQKGMTNDEAAVAAYKNIRTQKILLAVGTTAVVAGGAYAAYKIHDSRVDKIIKSGTILQNIASDDTAGVRDAFYSSKGFLDEAKYKGMYAKHLDMMDGKAFRKEVSVLSDIRQASPKSAKDTLQEIINSDSDFKKELQDYLKTNPLQGVYVQKSATAINALSNGKVDKDTYEVFNAALVDHSPQMQKLTDKYFNTLASKGYNALRDVNDSKYSGYKTLNPIIAFNTSGKVAVQSVEQLTTSEVNKAAKIAYTHIIGTEVAKQGAITATKVIGVGTGVSVIKNQVNKKQIDTYRKQNPGSKLTNTEIIRMYERSSYADGY